jgi:hypothetical protein
LLIFETNIDTFQPLAQTEVAFTLTRAFHLGFACQLSASRFPTTSPEGVLVLKSQVGVAGLLRGVSDFGRFVVLL